MANWQVISLDTTTPQLRAPGTGDGYSFNSGSTQLGVWTTTGLGIGTASPSYSLQVENSLATQLYLRGGASGYTHASIILASNTTFTPEIRALGTYMFNEGTDNTFYAGTLYTSANSWGIGVAAGATFQNTAADVTNAKFVVTSTGNVGIGQTNPIFKLVVSNAGAQGFEFDPSIGLMQVYNRSTASYGEFRPYASLMRFFTGSSPTETMRLDSSGRLLLNTTSARTNFAGNASTPLLQIEGITAATATASIVRGVNDTFGPTLNLGKTRGATVGANTVVADGDQLGIINFQGADGTNLWQGAVIQGVVDGTPGANDMPGRLVFSTTPDGSVNTVERMRISNAGNVVVNTAAVATTATDGFLYIPGCAGTPTGTPTAYTGRVPLVVDTTNNKLYFYSSGAWRDAGP